MPTPAPSPKTCCAFGGEGKAESPFPTLNQLHGFAELLTSHCAATWPQHVQHWHSPASGLLLPPGTAKDQASLSAHELSGMRGRGSEGCGQTLLQKASDFLTKRQWLLSLLTASDNMPVQAEAAGVSAAGWVGEGRQPRCVLRREGSVESQEGQLASSLPTAPTALRNSFVSTQDAKPGLS